MGIAEEVRALRAALKEDTATFAGRWLKSPRTIEDWEQGRRAPEAFVLESMRALAARTKAALARTKKKTQKAKL